MTMIIYLFIFIFGLIIGSFLNCVIFRIEKNEKFLFSRSYCPNCKHQLNWRDLIPIFSFLFLKGKCRYCKKKISIQYPLVEIFTGILFVLFVLFFEIRFPIIDIREIGFLIIIPFLVVIFVYDLKHFIIPDKVIYPAIVIALIYNLQRCDLLGRSHLLFSALGAAAFFGAIVLISRGKWMGIGDIKLAFLMGLVLGFPNILAALFLAFFLGAIIGIGLIIFNRKTLKSEVPFGPFLVTGTLAALFWGEAIINWYLNLI